MKLATCIVLFSALWAAPVLSAPVEAPSGFVAVPVLKQPVDKAGSLFRRDEFSTPLQNNLTDYFAVVQIGTPAQDVLVQLDTGSSDLWVFGTKSKAPQGTSYNSKKSKTSKKKKGKFQISYVDNSAAKGKWYADTVSVGGATVQQQLFAVSDTKANENLTTGVFGVGFKSGESSKTPYDNFPASLKALGLIDVNSYSLYLDDVDATTGTLLFGGIDHAKYQGTLAVLPIVSNLSFDVPFSVAGADAVGTLDSGTSLTYLDDALSDQIAEMYNASWNSTEGAYFIEEEPSGDPLVFTFGDVDIEVGIDELFQDNGDGTYYLTIMPASLFGNYTLLGDSFLRSAYVVYDLDDSQIGIAQARYSNDTDITAITGHLG